MSKVCHTCGTVDAPVIVKEGIIALCIRCAGDWVRSGQAGMFDWARRYQAERIRAEALAAKLKEKGRD